MNNFDLLFTRKIPAELKFQGFAWPHVLLLLLVLLSVFLSVMYTKRQENQQKYKLLMLFTFAVPLVYLFRFIVFALLDRFVEPQMSLLDRLPFHLCALNAIIMPFAVFRKNEILLNYMYGIALPAAAAAMLTPAMSYYGQYFYFSWQIVLFFIDHGLMVLVAVLAVCSGFFRPNYKLLPHMFAFFLAYCAVIYPVNKLLNQNYLFLNNADKGTVMAFFEAYLGNPGYLAAMALLVTLIVFLMYWPWFCIDNKSQAKHQKGAHNHGL